MNEPPSPRKKGAPRQESAPPSDLSLTTGAEPRQSGAPHIPDGGPELVSPVKAKFSKSSADHVPDSSWKGQYDPELVELVEEEEAEQRGASKRRRHNSIERQCIPQPNTSPSFLHARRSRAANLLHQPDLMLDGEDWSQPGRLIRTLNETLQSKGDHELTYTGAPDALEALENFTRRVNKDHCRFRHPNCQAVHSLLTMAGYHNALRMSLCMTESKSGKICPCSLRRYCAFCSWRVGRASVVRFVPAFDEDTFGFTFSWKFGGDVGVPFRSQSDFDRASVLWDLAEECLRHLASTGSGLAAGAMVAEQLAVTRLLDLRVNPHLHGLIRCARKAQPGYTRWVKRTLLSLDGYKPLAKAGIIPDLQFHPLESDTACARWINYSFAAFGLGKRGKCLDDRYDEARDRCRSDEDRVRLNEEVADLVDGFDDITTSNKMDEVTGEEKLSGRWRCLRTGCFHHKSGAFIGARWSKKTHRYLDGLYKRIEAEDRLGKDDDEL